MLYAPGSFGGTAPTSVNVTENVSVIQTIELGGSATFLSAVVESAAGSDDLIEFGVQFQGYADGPWQTYLSGADWASASLAGMLFCTTQSPATLAAEASAGFMIQVSGMYAIRFFAQCGSGDTATITIGGGTSGGGY